MISFPQEFHLPLFPQVAITMQSEEWEVSLGMNCCWLVYDIFKLYYSFILILILDSLPVNRHLINVTHISTVTELTTCPARNAKIVPKKKQTMMLGHITLETITRVEFIKAFLTIHSLHTQYAPGIHSGPAFRLSWSESMCIIIYLPICSYFYQISIVAGKAMRQHF